MSITKLRGTILNTTCKLCFARFWILTCGQTCFEWPVVGLVVCSSLTSLIMFDFDINLGSLAGFDFDFEYEHDFARGLTQEACA